jgi:hypothetical protein
VDKNVTIQSSNFPANIDFKVLMGPFGTLGIGGTSVTTINSGSGGSFTKTFDIPSGLKGSERIAIRLEGTTGGFLAFNWFWNNTATTTTTTPPGYTGIPTFSIVSVDADKNVKIQTNNFPANIDFKVLMGPFGTLGIGGTSVTTINSGSGGSFTKTFDIPSGLNGSTRIAIRLEGTTGGFLAFNWFWNNTATTTTTTTTGFTGIPTFSILSVNKDASVTIQANNFPANIDFKVLMGPFGTLGVGGTTVTTINSGSGGSFTKTFDIPSGLKGSTRIAIRLEGTTGGFLAFNWFWNN